MRELTFNVRRQKVINKHRSSENAYSFPSLEPPPSSSHLLKEVHRETLVICHCSVSDDYPTNLRIVSRNAMGQFSSRIDNCANYYRMDDFRFDCRCMEEF